MKRIFLVSVLILAPVAFTADYYVAPDGNDENPGSAGAPWATLQHAADTAVSGDTIHVRAGQYAQTVRFTRAGAPGALIRCVAEGSVTVDAGGADWGMFIDGYEDADGRYVAIEGFAVTGAERGGVRISWANGSVIRNCVCYGNGRWGIFTDYADDIQLLDNRCYANQEEHGIYVSNSGDRPVIRGNICYDNAGSGIQINADPAMPGDGITSEAWVENNLCYGNGSSGGAAINLASVRDSVIRNNLLVGNHAGGIACWGDGNGPDWGCKDNVFVNNTIVFDSDDGRWCISLKEASTDAVLLNNILIGGDDGALEFSGDSLAGLLSDCNVMHSLAGDIVVTEEDSAYYTLPQWQAGGRDARTVNVPPPVLFISQDVDGYRLNAGCAAVDSGAESHA
ncbi:right-handed parallel beta-helix repeat-containing protein, partial [bacterium]|nr:right-handed parallel beta-helix repeat-containing protein [candidate division CSSED10-310 bacterium]